MSISSTSVVTIKLNGDEYRKFMFELMYVVDGMRRDANSQPVGVERRKAIQRAEEFARIVSKL